MNLPTTTKVDSGRLGDLFGADSHSWRAPLAALLPTNCTPDRPWVTIEVCTDCGCLIERPVTEAEFKSWYASTAPDPTYKCSRCTADPR